MRDLTIRVNDSGKAEFSVTETDDQGRSVTYSGTGTLGEVDLHPETPAFSSFFTQRDQWQGPRYELTVTLESIKTFTRTVE